MKRALLALVLLAQAAGAQDRRVQTFAFGAGLMAMCTHSEAIPRDYCELYLGGIVDAESLHPGPVPLCLPHGVTLTAVRETVVAWVKQRPAGTMDDVPAAAIARAALSDRWPCEKRPA